MATDLWSHVDDVPESGDFAYGSIKRIEEFFGAAHPARVGVITFAPGEGGPLHYHEEPTEEYYYVLEGPIDVLIGDETVRAEPGTVVYTPPGTRHRPTNSYDEPAVLLTVVLPGEDLNQVIVEDG